MAQNAYFAFIELLFCDLVCEGDYEHHDTEARKATLKW